VIAALALASVIAVPAAPAQSTDADAPDRLFTAQGLELRSDERVFVLFAALNALGYSEETERKGPPLRAPVFHPIRVEVREALRKVDTAGVKAMFEQNPAEIEVYLEAILASGTDDKGSSAEAKKIASSLDALTQFRNKAELTKLFDSIAAEQRTIAKDLKARIEKDFAEAQRVLGAQVRAPASLVVVPNPLDGHDAVRVVETKERTYIVAGPGFPAAERAVLSHALGPALKKAIDSAWGTAGGQRYAKHWESLKGTFRNARRYPDGRAYLSENIARVLTFKIRAKVDGRPVTKEAEEDYLDELNKEGFRWSRFVARALDGVDGSEPFESALVKGLTRSAP
jgi:hypothetical protein